MREHLNILILIRLTLVTLFVLGAIPASAQYYKERGLVREGNKQFERRNFRSSLNRYNEALEHDSTSYEALYNRANAYHHTRKSTPEDSTYTDKTTFRNYERIVADTLLSSVQRAEVLRNLGESLFSEERYEAALNAFRESLKLNPNDQETKYDFVLTKRIVDQKRNTEQQQQQNQDQNQQGENNKDKQNDNQQGDNNKEKRNYYQQGDNNKDEQNDNQPQEGDNQEQPQDGEDENDEEQPNEGEAPRPEELTSDKERMLNAIQAEEDKTQEKLKEGEKAFVVRGKKNW